MTDCLIAAVAIGAGVAVLHRDDDFDVLARHTELDIIRDGPALRAAVPARQKPALPEVPAWRAGPASVLGSPARLHHLSELVESRTGVAASSRSLPQGPVNAPSTRATRSARALEEVVARSVPRYTSRKSMRIRHKGLRALHEQDDPARLPADLVSRLRRILVRLQDATRPGDADAPGFRLHPLKGARAGEWSVRVSGNWRVVFRFEGGEVVDVDLVDYH